jgi:acyl-CoA synthetase (NDP forming)
MFESLFTPKGIAVVGSASPGKLGNVITNRLLEGGFEKVFPINPKAMGVGERKGYSSVCDVPEEVDLAILACPVAVVPSAMEDCGKGGIKAAVIITSGFRESGNIEAEKETLAVARKYGIRFVGPNCAGLLNTHYNLIGTLETTPQKGNVAFISQSGSMGGVFMGWAKEQGLGISKFVSFGNSLDWKAIDYLNYLKDDKETDVIALYLEEIQDGHKFMEVMKEVTKVKPVVVIKAGRTKAGSRATISHTGSMAGEDRINDAAMKECGAIRVYTVSEMFSLCKALSTMKLVEGKRIMLVTNSGGPAIMACDQGEDLKLDIKPLSEETQEKLKTYLPPHASLNNPIDLTVEGTPEWYKNVLIDCLPEYDGAVVIYVGTTYLNSMPVAQAVVEAAKVTQKPIITNFTVGPDIKEGLEYLYKNGIPNFTTGEECMWVFSKVLNYYKHLDKEDQQTETPEAIGSLGEVKTLPEDKVMEILKKCSLPVPTNGFAKNLDELKEICERIGYPVVLKIVSPKITHKSDVGGVKLNIKNYDKAVAAYKDLAKIGGDDFQGAMVYPMLKQDGIEVILGLKRDPAFGPVILFGLGGIYSELFKDISLKIAPINEVEAMEMIKSIKAYPLLSGARGSKPKNTRALAKTMMEFSKLPYLYPDIKEVDLNPVMVYENGVTIADARIIL